jgi:hypothetical protein
VPRGHRLAVMEEENFQVWRQNEVERLEDEQKRLESMHAADIRRLRKAELAWWSLIRKGFLACLGLVALLLWYMNSYSETRGALKEVCAFIVREVSANVGGTLAEDFKEIKDVCDKTSGG